MHAKNAAGNYNIRYFIVQFIVHFLILDKLIRSSFSSQNVISNAVDHEQLETQHTADY